MCWSERTVTKNKIIIIIEQARKSEALGNVILYCPVATVFWLWVFVCAFSCHVYEFGSRQSEFVYTFFRIWYEPSICNSNRDKTLALLSTECLSLFIHLFSVSITLISWNKNYTIWFDSKKIASPFVFIYCRILIRWLPLNAACWKCARIFFT